MPCRADQTRGSVYRAAAGKKLTGLIRLLIAKIHPSNSSSLMSATGSGINPSSSEVGRGRAGRPGQLPGAGTLTRSCSCVVRSTVSVVLRHAGKSRAMPAQTKGSATTESRTRWSDSEPSTSR